MGLESAFERVIDRHIAGDPMNEEIRWTHLTRQEIADLLLEEEDIRVSVTVIDQLLTKQKFRRCQALKTKATGNNPLRNEQFENIERLFLGRQVSEKFLSNEISIREADFKNNY